MPKFRLAVTLATCLALPLALGACSLIPSGGHADLAPTLSFQDEPGGPVAFQSGQPVPTFDRQPRLRAASRAVLVESGRIPWPASHVAGQLTRGPEAFRENDRRQTRDVRPVHLPCDHEDADGLRPAIMIRPR